MATENINVSLLQSQYAAIVNELEREKRRTGGPSEPPGGGELESRVAAIEKAIPDMREALIRIETMLGSFDKHVFPNLSTKADLINETSGTSLAVANFRNEITRVEGSMIKWFIGTAIVLSGGVGAIAFGLARALS
ncbi:hypothetical protein [Pseudomonas protegens]